MKKVKETKESIKYQNNELKNYRFMKKIDYKDRVLAFMVDLIVMISPMMLWDIVMLAVLGSLLSFTGLKIFNIIVVLMLIYSIFFLNNAIYPYTDGQSLGMNFFNFKVIKKNGKRASKKQINARYMIGFAIPFVILMYFTSIFGILLYWGLNSIVFLLDKKHRSIIDFITRTYVVRVVEHKQNVSIKSSAKQTKKSTLSELPSLNQIDLHIHSTFSNKAKYDVEEIFQLAKRNGLKAISITDLNTVKANAIALHMSELYGVQYISGVEICAQFENQVVNVLGYFIDPKNELYRTIENDTIKMQKKTSIKRVALFEKALNVHIDIDRLLSDNRFQQISPEMLAAHVLNHPKYNDNELLKPYRNENCKRPIHELVNDYFVEGKSCYVPMTYPLLQDVIDVIKLSKGVVVLANPYDFMHNHRLLFEKALDLGVEGLEVFRCDYTDKEMVELMKVAKENKLFVTCGSDFYNDKHGNTIGNCNCPKAAEELVEIFMYTNR